MVSFDLLASEVVVIKVEDHTIGTEPEYQGNAPADFYTGAVAAESVEVMAHAD